ncbi:MAG TPA: DegT/DnrJ/EryC1/StrS family aminotransferase [Phycisphaerales bacterium]|nr:DegT/DnrJ/EryC1/StrS family aminotransferase [Phycisphaerales bacterium]
MSTTAALAGGQGVGGRTAGGQLAIKGGKPVAEQPVPIVSVTISEDDIAAAVGVMKSGMMAQGKNCLALEQAFAAASNAKHAFTCANGTCALQLAYEPLFERGDEVLVPGWTYIATVSMVVARGGIPVFCDADPKTYNFDVKDAEKRITPRTKAIAVTHLYGNPVDIDAVQSLAARKGLKVIYDAAQAHLATYKGQGIGTFGDAVTYSFYPTKNMTTGEGGLVTVNDDTLAAKIKLLRSHGETSKYVHGSIGFNYRMTDLEGAIGLSQFQRLPGYTKKRRDNAAVLDKAISGIRGLRAPKITPGAESAYHLYAVAVEPEMFVSPESAGIEASAPTPGEQTTIRDVFVKALNAEGVLTAIHYPRPLTRQPVFEKMVKEHLPVCESLSKTLFCIPIHHNLSERQLSQMGEALAKVADALRI